MFDPSRGGTRLLCSQRLVIRCSDAALPGGEETVARRRWRGDGGEETVARRLRWERASCVGLRSRHPKWACYVVFSSSQEEERGQAPQGLQGQ